MQATVAQAQQQVQADVQQEEQQQHTQHTDVLLLSKLDFNALAQCQQALHTLRQRGFQVHLQPAGDQLPATSQLAGNCRIAFLQAGHAAAQPQGASAAASKLLQESSVQLAPQHSATALPAQAAAATAPRAPAAAADAVARIAAPGRSSAKQQQPAPAAGNRQVGKSNKRKAAAAADTIDAEEPAEAAEEGSHQDSAKYRDSKLLAFGQALADEVLAKLETSGVPSISLDMPLVMQLLQPIVGKMQKENPAALGDLITPEHKAYVATACRKSGGSSSSRNDCPVGQPAAAAAAAGGAAVPSSSSAAVNVVEEGVLRYEHIEQLFSQLNVEEAARHCGMGKTKFKAIIRNFGITRWPYREFCSMYLAQEYLDAKSSNSAKRAKDAALLPGRRLLLVHALQLLQQHPNMEFRGHPAYVLTQVLHKQKHKRRKVEERHADESAAQVLTHIRRSGDE